MLGKVPSRVINRYEYQLVVFFYWLYFKLVLAVIGYIGALNSFISYPAVD